MCQSALQIHNPRAMRLLLDTSKPVPLNPAYLAQNAHQSNPDCNSVKEQDHGRT